MKKYCDWWLLPLLACLLAGCGDDDYHYPSVKLEFLTAFSGADGYLRSVVTDEGETLPVVEDKTKTNIEANASVRVISNYASEVTADGTAGAVLYALSGVLSVVPQTVDKFEEGVKTDPTDVLGIWMGLDYLNMTLIVKENGEHKFHFIEDEVIVDTATGCSEVYLTLYHDAKEEVVSYTRRAYASVPLRQYAAEGIQKVMVHFSVHTVSVDDFSTLIANPEVQLLDVRTVAEYSEGHVPHSININVLDESFETMADSTLQKDKPVAVYCRSGKRSKKAAAILSKKGYIIYDLDKGFIGWEEADKEVEK